MPTLNTKMTDRPTDEKEHRSDNNKQAQAANVRTC